MPIPTPKPGEEKDDFISRCMGDSVMVGDYPDQNVRAGVCYTQWARNKAKELEKSREGSVSKPPGK